MTDAVVSGDFSVKSLTHVEKSTEDGDSDAYTAILERVGAEESDVRSIVVKGNANLVSGRVYNVTITDGQTKLTDHAEANGEKPKEDADTGKKGRKKKKE